MSVAPIVPSAADGTADSKAILTANSFGSYFNQKDPVSVSVTTLRGEIAHCAHYELRRATTANTPHIEQL